MSVVTHWLGKMRPALHAPHMSIPDAVAAVSLRDPARVIVATIDDNGTRRVGLVFEQDGVSVEVRLPNPDETLRELGNAVAWRDGWLVA